MKNPLGVTLRPALLVTMASASLALGCSSSSDDGGTGKEAKDPCEPGFVTNSEGACIVDPYRWEPAEQLDFDNVVNNGTGEPQFLDLPPPPKSGFRIIMEPQEVLAGRDDDRSQCWRIPDLTHRWIYTARIHTSPGMHHANLYGIAIDPSVGPEPYPNCRGRADGRIIGQFTTFLGGMDTSKVIIPTVLFANSTQVRGTDAERYALAPGYAYELPPGFEISTDVHLQNTTPDTIVAEAAWDFYTMPAAEVTNPAAMFVWIFFDFLIPPNSKHTLTAECDWGGGEVAAIMPHTHQWATGFNAEFGNATPRDFDGSPEPGTFQGMEGESLRIYERTGTGNLESDIQVYSPPVDTTGATAVKFECHFENTTSHDMCFGVTENEMCFLFGYVSPPEMQRVGTIIKDGQSCITTDPAHRGEPNTFNLGAWSASQKNPGTGRTSTSTCARW